MESSKSVFVFVPGAWHTPDCFDTIRSLLTEQGYDSHTVDLPSVGSASVDDGLLNDIAYTKAELKKLADDGKKLVVVVHSYGGMVCGGAAEGLGYAQRATAGEKGGIIMLVYMSAFVTPKGLSLKDMLGGTFLPWMIFKDGFCNSSQEEVVFYHDLPPEKQKACIAKLKHMPEKVFLETETYEPWSDMPCMYLFCDKDQAIPLAVQEQFAQTLKNPTIFHTSGSHSPFLSVPHELLQGLQLAAKDGREKSGISSN